MASRKEQKEAARQRRIEAEAAAAANARRTRRTQMTIGIVVGVIVVLAVGIAVSSGGGKSETGLLTGTKSQALVAQVRSLLSGIPQSGATLGNPSAPVTMTYYGDLECPVCQAFTLQGGFPQLVGAEVRQGKVKVVYRSFETATHDPTTFKTQQVAALAAGQQNHFWDYTELFYHQQGQEDTGYVTEAYLRGIAQQIPGLDFSQWQSARSSQTLAAQVSSDTAAAAGANVDATPTLIFSGPKGSAAVQTGVPSYSDLEATLKQVA